MLRNSDLNFKEDDNEFYKKYIQSKNYFKSQKIELLYEVLEDFLSNNGEDLKTWIGETNFRLFIYEIHKEKKVYLETLNNYISSNNIDPEEALTLEIQSKKVTNTIQKLYTDYQKLISKTQANQHIIDLKSFFINSKQSTIEILQKEFKTLKGKRMAILIFLLTEKGIISMDNNDRKKSSRIHFVRLFTEKEHPHINLINNYFVSVTGELKSIGKKDPVYLDIEKRLNKIVSNC